MAGALLVSDRVAARHGAALERLAPGRPVVVVGDDGPEGPVDDVEVAFFSGDLYPQRAPGFWRPLLRGAPRLAWLHTYSAGIDHPVFQTMLARGVRLTTSTGAAAVEIAHTAMLYLLALTRDLPGWLDAQRRHAWEPRPIRDLAGRLCAVLGLGPIGLATARLAAAFDMRVIGLRRTPRGDEPCETWPLARLDELLALADVVVVALPLAEDTRGLLCARRLGLLRPGALLVNVGRGELIDEEALVEALRARRLAGAGLDVFATEPLPPDHPLWDLPNVVVTPHSAGETPESRARAETAFLQNLERWMRGAPLANEAGRESTGARARATRGA